VCVVVDARRVVLGLVSGPALSGDSSMPIDEVMQAAPPTFRPNLGIAQLPDYLAKQQITRALVTTSDGVLIGLWRREDVEPDRPAGSG
jgi:Mg/Co/Ni transporter MgtE